MHTRTSCARDTCMSRGPPPTHTHESLAVAPVTQVRHGDGLGRPAHDDGLAPVVTKLAHEHLRTLWRKFFYCKTFLHIKRVGLCVRSFRISSAGPIWIKLDMVVRDPGGGGDIRKGGGEGRKKGSQSPPSRRSTMSLYTDTDIESSRQS